MNKDKDVSQRHRIHRCVSCKLSVWFEVIEVPFEDKFLREIWNEIKTPSSFETAENLQQAPVALQSNNRESCEQVKVIKSSWLFLIWESSMLSGLQHKAVLILLPGGLVEFLRGLFEPRSTCLPLVAFSPMSHWWSCYWKGGESMGTAGRAFNSPYWDEAWQWH